VLAQHLAQVAAVGRADTHRLARRLKQQHLQVVELTINSYIILHYQFHASTNTRTDDQSCIVQLNKGIAPLIE
jgi:hypothetical protein